MGVTVGRRCHDERGATAVLIAFSAVGLLAFGGLVMDGGNQFSQRRQMQNAADSSATAGANALYLYKVKGEPRQNIFLDASENAVRNGAILAEFSCELVRLDSAGKDVGPPTPCPESSIDPVPDDAWKVRVTVQSQTGTHLMKVVGIDSFTSNAGAAAALYAAAPSLAAAPFMICANPGVVGHPEPLLLPDVTDPTGWRINPDAISDPDVPASYKIYDVWGADIGEEARDCGQPGESFRGLVDNSEEHSLPGWWPIKTGNSSGNQISLPLIGGCTVADNIQIKSIPEGCEFALPLCVTGNGESGANFELHCEKLGRFKVTKNEPTGQQDMEAIFLGGGLLDSGAGAGVPTPGDVMVIKLSE